MIVLTVFSGGVTAVAAIAVSRRLMHDNSALHAAVEDIGAGRTPSMRGGPLTSDIERLRQKLHDTAQRRCLQLASANVRSNKPDENSSHG